MVTQYTDFRFQFMLSKVEANWIIALIWEGLHLKDIQYNYKLKYLI